MSAGQHRPQQLDALADQRAVVGEERRAADPGREPLELDAADAVALHAARGDRGDRAHAASSWRIRLRSNLLLGERGSSVADDHVARDHVQRQLALEHVDQLGLVEPPVGGARDEHDPLPEARVLDAERDRVAHEPGAVDDLLDLRRADPVAGGLDHLVVAADEVQEALVVGLDDVARPDGELGALDARVAAGGRLEAHRGLLRVVPVAHRDEAAAVDELALLAGLAGRAVGTHDEDLGVRDRLADRVRTAVDLGRVQVGRAEGLGQAVHQVRLGLREDRAQLRQRRLRHPPAGVGEVAQAARRLRPATPAR